MKIDAYTFAESCINAKRIYTDVWFKWTCPECNSTLGSYFNQIPLISYGEYCHNFVCDNCDIEIYSKMYKVNEIFEDSVDITLSDLYNLEVYEKSWSKL